MHLRDHISLTSSNSKLVTIGVWIEGNVDHEFGVYDYKFSSHAHEQQAYYPYHVTIITDIVGLEPPMINGPVVLDSLGPMVVINDQVKYDSLDDPVGVYSKDQ